VAPLRSYERFRDTRAVEAQYDAMGRPTVVRHADGTVTTTTYDVFGLPESLSIGGTELAHLQRSRAGVVRARTSPGTTQTFDYDALGRVTQHVVIGADEEPIAGESLSWDLVGNVESVESVATGLRIDYGYDSQYQLRTAVAEDPTAYTGYFEYSKAGRVQLADVAVPASSPGAVSRTVTHQYDPPGSDADPAAVRSLVDTESGDTVASFDYDERGNVVQRFTPMHNGTLVYDGDNQLREYTNTSTGSREVYYYDGAERVLAFREDPSEGVDGRLWLGDVEVGYYPGGVAWTRADLALGAYPVARVEDGDTPDPNILFHGVLGSLLAVTDIDGDSAARYAYGPWGEILWQSGDDVESFSRLYNDKELDRTSELGYYGYRYYDRLTLGWSQLDPLYELAPDLAMREPLRASLYAFNLNNPLRYLDPDGRDGRPSPDAPWVPTKEEAEQQEAEDAQTCPGSYESDGMCVREDWVEEDLAKAKDKASKEFDEAFSESVEVNQQVAELSWEIHDDEEFVDQQSYEHNPVYDFGEGAPGEVAAALEATKSIPELALYTLDKVIQDWERRAWKDEVFEKTGHYQRQRRLDKLQRRQRVLQERMDEAKRILDL